MDGTISKRTFGYIAIALGLVLAGLVIDRVAFLMRAEHVTAEVYRVAAVNAKCGTKGGTSCTRFEGTVRFTAGGRERFFEIGCGDEPGYDQPVSMALCKEHDPVEVLYDPRNPSENFMDSTFDLWITPVLVGMALFGTVSGALGQRNARTRPGREPATRGIRKT